MLNYDLTNNFKGQSYVVVGQNSIIEVSQSFVDMTEYNEDELLNKEITEIFKTLRIGPNFDIENIGEQRDYFLFTKSLEVRFVYIKFVKEMDEKIYFIEEKPNSMLGQKFTYLYQLLSEDIMGISIYNVPDLTLLKANQAYLDFFDSPNNTPVNTFGKRLHDILTGYKGICIESILEDALSTGKSQCLKEYEYYVHKRGTTYWDIFITPIKENKNVRYIIINTQDVTEKVLNKKAIEKHMQAINFKNKQLNAQNNIIENMSDGLSIFNGNGEYISLNKAAREMFFPNFSDIEKADIGFTQAECFDEKGNKITIDRIPANRVMKGEKLASMGMKVKFPNKVLHINISGTPIYDENNDFIMGILCSRDVSQEVAYEEKLKKQKELFQSIVDNLQESLFVCDKDGNFILKKSILNEINVNEFNNYNQLYRAGDVYKLDGTKLSLEDTVNYRVIHGETVKNEIIYNEFNGNKYYYLLNGMPVFDKNDNFSYGIINMLDITDLMKSNQLLSETQTQLLQAERDKNLALQQAIEMKDEFLSLISHDLRTPLTVIDSAIQAMNCICGDELSDKSKKYIKTIRQNTFRQLRLVNNLLDIMRVNSGRIKVNKRNVDIVFLTKTIVDSVYSYASQSGVKLTFVSAFVKKIIGIDDEKYERILLNLLSNAIKFTPEGKSIIVKLRSAKEFVCIQVKDTGIGIPENKAEIIFDKFGQVDSSLSRRAEGSGIGLSLVKRFVEALGGSISVKSKLGKGSTFTVLLPKKLVSEDQTEEENSDLLGNRLVQVTDVEFSDIYE